MKICIIAHKAFGAISGGVSGHSGGVEHQTSLMAKWFAKNGHDVSFLTSDEGQDDITLIGTVKVIKMCRWDTGIPVIRFFSPRWSSLLRALKQADADVYYHNCAEYVTGQVALWCKFNRRSFVYSVASNSECEPDLKELGTIKERLFFKYGLHLANKIIVQGTSQKEMLKKNFKLDSTPLPMPCAGPTENEFIAPRPPSIKNCRVVWVGRITPVKQLELFLDVAEALPTMNFYIAGKPDRDDAYSKMLLSRARSISNLTVLGRISRKEMSSLYKKASFLCCTSRYEGFPNTFLEAWSHGIPLVTTFDPDYIVKEKKLGETGLDKNSIISSLKHIASNPEHWTELSKNARHYYVENHTVDSVMNKFKNIFIDAVRQ